MITDLLRSITRFITTPKPSLTQRKKRYRQAFQHTSHHPNPQNSNERLELLGDAVIGLMVLEYLYDLLPEASEGELTRIKSHLVSRPTLNKLARDINIPEEMNMDPKLKKSAQDNIYGNALEAFIAAIYRQEGYKACQQFFIHELMAVKVDINEAIFTDNNHRSKLSNWVQKEKKKLCFSFVPQKEKEGFIATLYIDGHYVGEGSGSTKKNAAQAASEVACQELGIRQSQPLKTIKAYPLGTSE